MKKENKKVPILYVSPAFTEMLVLDDNVNLLLNNSIVYGINNDKLSSPVNFDIRVIKGRKAIYPLEYYEKFILIGQRYANATVIEIEAGEYSNISEHNGCISFVMKEENNMLSASEARTKTQNNINDCTTKELAKLEEQMANAILEGKFSISNDGCLQFSTRQRLEELGYKVTTGSQYNEPYYSISWQ